MEISKAFPVIVDAILPMHSRSDNYERESLCIIGMAEVTAPEPYLSTCPGVYEQEALREIARMVLRWIIIIPQG
jgi:hypothetical protein